MAKKFLTPIGLVSLPSDPATGIEGQVYFNTTTDSIKIYANDVWTELQGGGGGSVIYTANQPDTTDLEVGTIWVDSNAEITSDGNVANLDSYLTIISASSTYATKTELNNINLTSTINTASAAAYASASAYTNSAISSFQALPNQSGNNGKYLTTNGSSTSWVPLDLNSAIQTASAAAVTYLVDGAPAALNTLNELAAALNDNANILDTLLTTTAASSTYLPLTASASFYRWTKTYSASASVISGVDDNSISLSYNAGYIQLFINGVMLDPSEYTATSGSAITVSTPVLSGEVVDIFAFLNSTSVNTYSQAQIDNKYNNLTRWKKIYSASATVISGNDDNSLPLSYTSGYEQVYLNGILLTPITDYARTSASVITLPSAVVTNDVIEIINTQPFNVADVYNTSQANSTFLTQASASTTYLTQSSASGTYLTQNNASSTYATKSDFPADAWTSFTPVIKQGATTLTANVAYARYKKIGKTVFLQIDATITNTGSTNGAITIDVPSGVFPINSTNEGVLGNMYIRDTGTAFYAGIVATNGVIFFGRAYGSVNSMGASNPAFTLVNNDTVSIQVTYEVS